MNQVQKKLTKSTPLTDEEDLALDAFLTNIPKAKQLLADKYPLDEQFEVQVFDFDAMIPHFDKWCNLFEALPKNGATHYPNAGWFDAREDKNFWKRGVVIEASFIPSLEFYRRGEKGNQIIGINLKVDGTATFEFWMIEDAEKFPELYNFRGSWKEAYLLTVKTLQEGWPQTKFPPELESLLKK